MTADTGHPPAHEPADLSRFFVDRANAGDLDGLVALYEPDAVLALRGGRRATGHEAIREAFEKFLAGRPTLNGTPQAALTRDDLALTSTLLPGGGATVEVARRQPDGTWLWAIDQPSILGA
jgi:uncharacterized protein (TIGR02246 family)